MFVDPHLLKTAAGPIAKSQVKTVIVNDSCMFAQGGEVDAFKAANPDLTVYTYDELRKLGEDDMVDPEPAKASDIYCIMYTSGSTGPPKGACITHQSLVAGSALPRPPLLFGANHTPPATQLPVSSPVSTSASATRSAFLPTCPSPTSSR